MSWHRVDDKFAAHPKVEALEEYGPERHAFAVAAWTLLGSDCAHLDDGGVIAPLRVRKVLAAWPEKRRAQAIADLVSVGLVDETDTQTAFHDWDYYRKQDRTEEERREYEARKKAAQRARKRENVRQSATVPGHSGDTSPGQVPGRSPAPRARALPVPSRPSRPVPPTVAQGTGPPSTRRAGDPSIELAQRLHDEWRRVQGSPPGLGSVEQVAAVWAGTGGSPRSVAAHAERVRMVVDLAALERDPPAWLTAAIEGFARDPYVLKQAAGFELFAANPAKYARAAKHPSAVDDFSHANTTGRLT